MEVDRTKAALSEITDERTFRTSAKGGLRTIVAAPLMKM